MRYKCILIDHDDTVAPTTEFIHYPSFKQSLKILKPQVNISFDEYMKYSFLIGFEKILTEILQLNEEEIKFMYTKWKEDTVDKIGIFYEEIKLFIKEFISKGGILAVVTHSDRERVEKDYLYNIGVIPKDIYSWEMGEYKRKPNPYPILDMKKKYNLKNDEILVIDDLKPGYLMAKEAGVDFLWVTWAYPNITKFNEDINGDKIYKAKNFIELNNLIKL